MKHGKKYLESAKLIESSKLYDPDEAVKLALQTAKTKFDETMEISVRLGVDPRQADQQVRGAVVLPHGTGKKVRVLVFAKGEQAKAAEEAARANPVPDIAVGLAENLEKAGLTQVDTDASLCEPVTYEAVKQPGRPRQ